MDWNQLLKAHGERVWRAIYRLLNHAADAQDCYQETFLAAYRLADHSQVRDWSSLLVTIATRKAMDRLRQRYQEKALQRNLRDAKLPSPEHSPDARSREEELMENLRSAMLALPGKQAEVFWLSCLEGFSPSQIAERLQIDSGEVRVLLHRARTALAETMGLRSFLRKGKS